MFCSFHIFLLKSQGNPSKQAFLSKDIEVCRDKVFRVWSFSWIVAGAFGNSIWEYYIPQYLRVNAGVSGDAGLIPGSGRFPGVGNGNSLQYSCLENPMDREVWQATVHGVTKSQTQLKRLSTMHLVTKPPPPCRLQRQLQWSSCFLSLFNSSCYQVCFEVGRSCVPYHISLIIYLANIVPDHGLKLPIKQSFIFLTL